MEEAPPSIIETNFEQSQSSDKIMNTNENILKIESGEYDFTFHKWSDAQYMINSKGDRKYTKFIFFKKKFENKPNVMVSLKGIDSGNYKNTRINLFARDISNIGFNLECLTWSDSITYAVYSSWIAIGY